MMRSRPILFLFLSSLALIGATSACYGTTIAPWGIDSDLAYRVDNKKQEKNTPSAPSQRICHALIHFFQVYISPIDGPRSSFYPSSSQYTLEAIERYGAISGILLGCDRLLRENKELWVYSSLNQEGICRKLDPVR